MWVRPSMDLKEPLIYFFCPTQNRAWPLVFLRLNILVFVELERGFFFFLSPFNLNLIPSLMALMVKNLPAMWEAWVRSGFGKIPWRRAWQPTPVFSPGESPWTEEPGGLQFMGSQIVGHDWRLSTAHRKGKPLTRFYTSLWKDSPELFLRKLSFFLPGCIQLKSKCFLSRKLIWNTMMQG